VSHEGSAVDADAVATIPFHCQDVMRKLCDKVDGRFVIFSKSKGEKHGRGGEISIDGPVRGGRGWKHC
jgi:hypothetical protein